MYIGSLLNLLFQNMGKQMIGPVFDSNIFFGSRYTTGYEKEKLQQNTSLILVAIVFTFLSELEWGWGDG
jgi:hypothetical protein